MDVDITKKSGITSFSARSGSHGAFQDTLASPQDLGKRASVEIGTCREFSAFPRDTMYQIGQYMFRSRPGSERATNDRGVLTDGQLKRKAGHNWLPRDIRLRFRSIGGAKTLLNGEFHYYHVVSDSLAGVPAAAACANLGPQQMAPQAVSPVGLTPQQLRTAYGINSIMLGSIPADGAGQTIAIIDAYDAPNFVNSTDSNFANSDLHQFDLQFGLPDPPSFQKMDQNGGSNLPAASGSSGWSVEASLDVEWAHAVAPMANIILVEANSSMDWDLLAAVDTARHLPGRNRDFHEFRRQRIFRRAFAGFDVHHACGPCRSHVPGFDGR